MAARPAARRHAAPPPALPARPAVRDFRGAGSNFRVEWDVRPVYDFVFSLTAHSEWAIDIAEADQALVGAGRARVLQEIGPTANAILDKECGIHIASFAVERPELRDAGHLLEAIEATPTPDFFRSIMSELAINTESEARVEDALLGDAAALAELRAIDEGENASLLALLEDPAASHRLIVEVFRIWLELFKPVEARLAAIGERDHAMRADDRATLEPVDLIERTTGGIRYLPEPRIRRVILAPCYFTRPYNYLLAGEGWRFFGYPASDDALSEADPLAAPQSVVRLHRALGDETRLRILKLLAEKDLYLTEIAQALDLSKPTIKHHLAQLRVAGLVTVTEAGSVIYYSLRRNRLDEASIDLKRFLIG